MPNGSKLSSSPCNVPSISSIYSTQHQSQPEKISNGVYHTSKSLRYILTNAEWEKTNEWLSCYPEGNPAKYMKSWGNTMCFLTRKQGSRANGRASAYSTRMCIVKYTAVGTTLLWADKSTWNKGNSRNCKIGSCGMSKKLSTCLCLNSGMIKLK